MLDFSFGDLDLGSRRKSTEWVSFAPEPAARKKPRPKTKVSRGCQLGAEGSSSSAAQSSQHCPGTEPQRAKGTQPKEGEGGSQMGPGVEGLSEKMLRINATLWNSESRSSAVEWLSPESEDGNTEYKLRLRSPPPCRFEQLVTQMQYRLSEGGGLAYYYIGVEDNGYPRGLDAEALEQSLATVMRMADELDAAATVDRVLHAPRGRLAVRLTVCKLATDEARYEDTRVVVLGGTGSGKSTLVSVLCHGADGRPLLDNGRGRARTAVFRHKHEVETGRTSALSQDSVGYDGEGCVINYTGVSTMTQAEVSARARKLVTLIDVGGHKRFIKTAMNGLTAMTPDYAMFCIPCPALEPVVPEPLSDTMMAHLTAAIGLGVPLFIVITKEDVGQELVTSVLERLQSLFQSSLHSRSGDAVILPVPQLVRCNFQAQDMAEGMLQGSERQGPLLPVFAVSSVSGAGLPLLHSFLSSLSRAGRSRSEGATCSETMPEEQHIEQAAQFQVGHMFEVENVGSVASGSLLHGSVSVGDHLWLGPGKRSSLFTHCRVTSIHRSQLPVRCITAGQTATVALHPANVPIPPCQSNPPDAWQIPDSIGASHLDSFLRPSSMDASGGSPVSSDALVERLPSLETWPQMSGSPLMVPSRAESFCGSESQVTSASDYDSSLSSLQDVSDLLFTRERVPVDRRWTQVGLTHGVGSSQSVVSHKRSSRGRVLLGYGLSAPKGALEFEAELVVFPGGRWPVRGMGSGCHSPTEMEHGVIGRTRLDNWCGGMPARETRQSPQSDVSTTTVASRSSRRKRKAADRRVQYTCVIHCGCASQAAHVSQMEDISEITRPEIDGKNSLTAAMAAAHVLRNHEHSCRSPTQAATWPTIIRARFRFANHAEWLIPGCAMVVQDRTEGLLAAVGVVTRVYPFNCRKK